MRILLASGEVHPYSKTGGLGDMASALAKALAAQGNQVGIVTPLYRGIREKFRGLKPLDYKLATPLDNETITGSVWTLEPRPGLTIYFIDQPRFFNRPELYQERGVEYPDNAQRFIFLSKAVAHLARHLELEPEIVHVHDWHVGMTPLFIRHQRDADGWTNAPATVLTIHNLAYQGAYPAADYRFANLPNSYFSPSGVEFYKQVNFLKAAIVYSDTITTVSPKYATEITTPEFGCGLDGVLRGRATDLVGILNGVDYDEWRTNDNPFLPGPYNASNLSGKNTNKLAVQREMGLPQDPAIPLFGSVTRLAHQKGVDMTVQALESVIDANFQFVILGSGQPEFERAVLELAKRYPQKVAAKIGFDNRLSHRIEAGCDFFLMPSRFEPCGLNQMYSLRYGTVPIVRATGGLDDSVTDAREDLDFVNGIKFNECSPEALAKAIRKALALYDRPELLHHVRINGMAADFSWESTAQRYVDVYHKAIAKIAAPVAAI